MVEIEVWVLLIISVVAIGGWGIILCYLIGSWMSTNRLKKEQAEQRIRNMEDWIKRQKKQDKEDEQ